MEDSCSLQAEYEKLSRKIEGASEKSLLLSSTEFAGFSGTDRRDHPPIVKVQRRVVCTPTYGRKL